MPSAVMVRPPPITRSVERPQAAVNPDHSTRQIAMIHTRLRVSETRASGMPTMV
jgi:hypothetical protein